MVNMSVPFFPNLDICILSRFILPRTKFVQVQPRFFLVEPEVEPCPRNSKNTACREARW
jgi:hypothetical protein